MTNGKAEFIVCGRGAREALLEFFQKNRASREAQSVCQGGDEPIYDHVIWSKSAGSTTDSISRETGVFRSGENGLFGQYVALHVMKDTYRWEMQGFWADKDIAASKARGRGEQLARAFLSGS